MAKRGQSGQLKKTEKNKARFLEKLEAKLGNITLTCKATGLSRSQVYKWRETDPDFAAAVEEVNEVTLDFVESKLLKQIADDDTTAIIFFLKTRGKKRGYVEKQQVEAVGRTQIQVQVSNEKTAQQLKDILGNADNKDI